MGVESDLVDVDARMEVLLSQIDALYDAGAPEDEVHSRFQEMGGLFRAREFYRSVFSSGESMIASTYPNQDEL